MQTSTSVAPAPSLGIREFSRQSGYSEAKVRRAMRELSIKGQFQGRGKATLLNPAEQERLALHIDEIELQGDDRSAPSPPKATPTTKRPAPSNPIPRASASSASDLVAEQTEANPDGNATAPQPAEAPEPLPSTSTESATLPAEAGQTKQTEADNAAVLDQLWEARQAIRNGPAQTEPKTTSAPIHPPTVSAPLSQSTMTSSPHPSSPDNAPSQTAQSYYDPYFDAHPAIAPTTQIQPGNHRQTIAPQNLPESYDLGQFRSEDTITTLADPGAIAAQAMGAINALVQGMDADIHQQRIHLEETQRAAQTLRLKAKQLQDKKIEYMIQSSTLGQAQQQSTLEIQEALEGIQALGKSPSGEPTSPSSSPSSPSPSA